MRGKRSYLRRSLASAGCHRDVIDTFDTQAVASDVAQEPFDMEQSWTAIRHMLPEGSRLAALASQAGWNRRQSVAGGRTTTPGFQGSPPPRELEFGYLT